MAEWLGGEVEEKAQGAVVVPKQGSTALRPSHAWGSKPNQGAPAPFAGGAVGQVGSPLYAASAGFTTALGLIAPKGAEG